MRWVLSPLSLAISKLPEGSVIIDIGCGTGDYIFALSEKYNNYKFFRFDLSEEMLNIAKSHCRKAKFCIGNADEQFPYSNNFADMLFCVDVIHHLSNLTMFFNESYHVLKSEGILVIVTDSEDDIPGEIL